MSNPPEVPAAIYDRMVEIRRDLHRNPELSWKEERTAKRVVAELERLGLSCRTGVAGTGVVADIAGTEQGPLIALRADMDALPVNEETGLSFSSEVAGVMHACGHDGHTSMLLGAAALLVAEPPLLPVRLIFQPAEEHAKGAPAMMKEGVLEGVAMIFGGHVDRHYLPGTIIVNEGPMNASTDLFQIEIRGQGGHGARPHEALDAVVVGSLLVTAIQTIVSREVNPAHPSVLTVGSFVAGKAPNVIADRATLGGTIRSQHPEVRAHLHRSLIRIGEAIGMLHGAEIDVVVELGTPVLSNTADMAELAREAAELVVGEANVRPLDTPNMGGEDFACFLEDVPGAYVRFGAQVEGRESFPAHSSRFDFDERALAVGARFFDHVARRAAEKLR